MSAVVAERASLVGAPYLVVDDFLPAALAEEMRGDIDAHFAEPQNHRAESHQVWNYWFVPELYTYLRTAPEKVVAHERVTRFYEALRGWSIESLGMAAVTWPYLSLYVSGCRQMLHNDSVNGRFGFVFSLTRNERRTTGGETVIMREGDLFRGSLSRPGAGRNFYEAIPPRFNRLVLFDDRLPHAVERVDGSMSPVEGRFVLHGHISEGGLVAQGALAAEAAAGPVTAGMERLRTTLGDRMQGYHGPLILRLELTPEGAVASCRVLVDRVMRADGREWDWQPLLGQLIAACHGLRFPPAPGPTELSIPIVFGGALATAR